MKKYIFTESQYNKLVKTILKEDEEVSVGMQCYPAGYAAQKSLMKNCEISDNDSPNEMKQLLKTGKFKVIKVDGSATLNGKRAAVGMIITPETTIEVCMSTYIYISGMGYPEAFISWGQNNVMFGSQHA